MNEHLKALITKCVLKDIYITGSIGSNYTVQDLLHTVGLKSIDAIYKRLKKEVSSLTTDSLYENANTVLEVNLQLQLDVIKAVFVYKQGLAKAKAEAAVNRAEKAEKLRVLQGLRTTKQLEKLGSLTEAELDAQIAEIQA